MENFFKILESFFELDTIFENNSCVGFMQVRWGEAFVLNSTLSSLFMFRQVCTIALIF